MPCEDKKKDADDAADKMHDAVENAWENRNDLNQSFADYQDADKNFWDSLGSDDPDAAGDAYDKFRLAEEDLVNDFEAAGEAADAALEAFNEWDDALEKYCDCVRDED